MSIRTTVLNELTRHDADYYWLTSTMKHSFDRSLPEDQFTIFATCSPLLREPLTVGCDTPFSDTWFIPNQNDFQNSVDAMLATVGLDVQYRDRYGNRRRAHSPNVWLEEVPPKSWPSLLSFFRESLGTLPQQRVVDHYADLRIFQCDLSGLDGGGHDMAFVERFALRISTLQAVDDGYCWWYANHPCFVEDITFAVNDFGVRDERGFKYCVMPFNSRSRVQPTGWLEAGDMKPLEFKSWLLPGQGAALLWKAK